MSLCMCGGNKVHRVSKKLSQQVLQGNNIYVVNRCGRGVARFIRLGSHPCCVAVRFNSCRGPRYHLPHSASFSGTAVCLAWYFCSLTRQQEMVSPSWYTSASCCAPCGFSKWDQRTKPFCILRAQLFFPVSSGAHFSSFSFFRLHGSTLVFWSDWCTTGFSGSADR